MQPACGFGIGDGFADGHRESDDVVADASFDFVDASDVNFCALAEARGGVTGDDACIGERVCGGELNVEPFLEAIRVAPDAAHGFAGVAGDHGADMIASRECGVKSRKQ